MAYDLGRKGVTIYRDGSREEQVLSFGKASPQAAVHHPPAPARRTTGITERINTGCGKLYVTVNQDDQGFCEVFAQMGKTGGCACSQIESTGRLISLALRSGVKIDAIIKQITGIRCPAPTGRTATRSSPAPTPSPKSWPTWPNDPPAPTLATMGSCPDCGGAVEHEGGCFVCRCCGFSRCS